MTHARAPVLAVIAWLVVVVLVGQSALLLTLTWDRRLHDDLFGAAGGAGFGVLALTCATVGAMIVIRVRGNVVGAAFLAIGVLAAASLLAYQYAAYVLVRDPGGAGAATAVWANGVLGEPVAPLLGVALLTFPDGRLSSPRWRPAPVVAALATVLLVASDAFVPGRFDAPFAAFTNPLGVGGSGAVMRAMDSAGWVLAVLVAGAGVAAMARRRGSLRPDQRRQLRLVLRVGVPAGAIVTADMAAWIAWDGLPERLGMAVIGLAFAAFAASVGVALVRVRLFEERRRIEGFVADVLAGRDDPEAIESLLARTLGDASLTVGYVLAGHDGLFDREGRPAARDADHGRVAFDVVHAGETIAVVRCAADVPADVLAELTADGAAAIDGARLRIGMRRQLEDLAVARSRIASAGEAERRRLQRDLHDGAQARLISVGLALRNLRRDAVADTATGRRLDAAVDELASAVGELRELSAGLPPSLLDAGLRPALAALADAVPVPVRVDVSAERFSPGVESTAYFVACEGVANAIKHARASSVLVTAERAADRLVVRVADDGVGGADAAAGRGLAGLQDRLVARGGLLQIDSRPTSGTTLTAELPCAS